MLAESTTTIGRFAATPPSSDHWRRSGDAPLDGVPYLKPSIQLLFKAKKSTSQGHRRLQRRAHRAAQRATHPDHPWLARLGDSANP
jgi:hypothetical protein